MTASQDANATAAALSDRVALTLGKVIIENTALLLEVERLRAAVAQDQSPASPTCKSIAR